MTYSISSSHAVEKDRRLAWILLIVSGAAFVDFLDVTVVNLAFPALRHEFGSAGVGELAWVITGYAVPFAALLTPAGRLADITGRRRAFLAGTALFVLSSLGSALAPTLGALVAARVFQGASAALTLPAGLSIVLSASPQEKRAKAIGVWGAAAGVAALVGPSLGGLLVSTVGWRAVFLINLPVGIAILLGAVRVVSESARRSEGLPDLLGALLIAAGLALFVLAVTQAPTWGWTATPTVAAAAGGVLAVAIAVWRSRRHPVPAVETSMWRISRFATANVASVLMGAAVYAWMLLCVLFLTGVWRYTEMQAGLAMTPGAVTGATTAALLGRRLEHGGQRAAVVGGSLVLAAVGFWLAAVLGTEAHFLTVWLPAGLLCGSGMGAMGVGISAAAATAVESERYAAATGLNLTARQVGGALGVAVLAAILQAGLPRGGIDPYLHVYLVCACCSLAAAGVALRLDTARSKKVSGALQAAQGGQG